jgi:hypothetical protein
MKIDEEKFARLRELDGSGDKEERQELICEILKEQMEVARMELHKIRTRKMAAKRKKK